MAVCTVLFNLYAVASGRQDFSSVVGPVGLGLWYAWAAHSLGTQIMQGIITRENPNGSPQAQVMTIQQPTAIPVQAVPVQAQAVPVQATAVPVQAVAQPTKAPGQGP